MVSLKIQKNNKLSLAFRTKVKWCGILAAAVLAACFMQASVAENLLQVFNDALANDPTFKAAEATWLAAKENTPIAVAQLLPNIAASGNGNDNYTRTSNRHNSGSAVSADSSIPSTTFYNLGYQLSLNQPIFNVSLWTGLRSANATVKAATATYMAAQQDLITRTVAAYLAVLQAEEVLRNTLANKRATYRQLVSAQQRFKVGLVAITEVYDAQANYDQIVAAQINAIDSLSNSLENLRAITGKYYTHLNGLNDVGIPLISPQPDNINAWLKTSQQQNYNLRAAYFNSVAALENVRTAAAAHLPVLNGVGGFGYNKNYDQPATTDATGRVVTSTVGSYQGNVGLSVTLPVFEGGGTVAKTEQQRYDYANAVANYEIAYRAVINQTTQFYLGVKSTSSQVKADRESIVSARNAVQSTEAGYQVGTRTLVDVLDDYTKLYQAFQQHANDQFSYINNYLNLKNQAGTLSAEDLFLINSWLTQSKLVAIPADITYAEAKQPPKMSSDEMRDMGVGTNITGGPTELQLLNEKAAKQLGAREPTSAATHLKNTSPAKNAKDDAAVTDDWRGYDWAGR